MSSLAPTPMIPKAASPTANGARPAVAGGIEGRRPLAISGPEIAQAGFSWRRARARSVTAVKAATSTTEIRSIAAYRPTRSRPAVTAAAATVQKVVSLCCGSAAAAISRAASEAMAAGEAEFQPEPEWAAAPSCDPSAEARRLAVAAAILAAAISSWAVFKARPAAETGTAAASD